MTFNDKFGVRFSNDGKTLEHCPKDFQGKYEIPFGVTDIGVDTPFRYDLDNLDNWDKDAFCDCSGLTEVIIPNSVKRIAGHAFLRCTSLKSVFIPDSVNEIGLWAFGQCSALSEIHLSNNLTNVQQEVFEGCPNIEKIYCSQMSEIFLELPSVKEIHTDNLTMQITKRNWYLKEVRLPEDYYPTWNIEVGNLLEEFLMRNGLGEINCQSLDRITVSSHNQNFDSREDCNAIIDTKANKLLLGCHNSIIPNGITAIANYAFKDCRKLKTIRIPESVVAIGDYAFSGCYNLTEIRLPNSTSSIGEKAFPLCKSFKKIIIPKGTRQRFIKMGLKDYYDILVEE